MMNMKTLIIRLLCALIVFGLSLALHGCSQNSKIAFNGHTYKYEVAKQYLKKPKSIIYTDKMVGDKNKIISLLMPATVFPGLQVDEEKIKITLLLFLDQDYSDKKGLKKTAMYFIDNAKELPLEYSLHHYKREGNNIEFNYHISFDSELRAIELLDNSFVVEARTPRPFEIGGVKTNPKTSCRLYTVHDGISMQMGTSGNICSANKYGSLRDYLIKLINSWKK